MAINNVKINTPRGVMQYPRLGKPDMGNAKYPKPMGEYNTKVRFDTSKADVQAFIARVSEAHEKLGKAYMDEVMAERIEKAKTPADKGKLKAKLKNAKLAASPVKPEFDEEGNENGLVSITAKMPAAYKSKKDDSIVNLKPIVEDSKGNKLDPKKLNIGAGSECRVALELRPYYNDSNDSYGVSIRMVAVRIVKLVEWTPGGGYEFGSEDEDGFVAGDNGGSAFGAAEDDADDSTASSTDSDDGSSDF